MGTSEWWTYRPEDFLMFSPRVYWRLFELHNTAWWPLQLIALALGIGMLLVLLRPRPWSDRLVFALLAIAWGFVGWAFVWQRYVPINWAMEYVAPLFGLQALLLLGLGGFSRGLVMPAQWSMSRLLGLVLFAYALLVHPLTALLAGRSWRAAEVFGLFPDPLAIATLGIVAMAYPARRAWVLLPVPALWCIGSWLTLGVMDATGAWLPLVALGLALGARLWPDGRRTRHDSVT